MAEDTVSAWTIRAFVPADQAGASALILAGLAEHFPQFDPTRNPDLADIWAHYPARAHVFLVATIAERIVATGGLIVQWAERSGEIVRVSVDPALRGHGLGLAIVMRLLAEARVRGLCRVEVETNLDWLAARRLYERAGFIPYRADEISIYSFITI